jgi:hypothetical protein
MIRLIALIVLIIAEAMFILPYLFELGCSDINVVAGIIGVILYSVHLLFLRMLFFEPWKLHAIRDLFTGKGVAAFCLGGVFCYFFQYGLF